MKSSQTLTPDELLKILNHWRLAFDVLPDMVFFHDSRCRILRVNHAYAEHVGLPFENILGRPYNEVFPKSSRTYCYSEEAFQKAKMIDKELELSEGEWYRVRIFPAFDDSGNYLHTVHIMQNITQNHQAEAFSHRLATALDQASEGVAIFARDLMIDYTNDAMGTLIGRDPATLSGESMAIWTPDRYESLADNIWKTVRDKGSHSGELMLEHVDGELIPVLLSASSMHDQSGALNGYVGTFLDLRSLKAQEERYRLLKEQAPDAIFIAEVDSGRIVDCNLRAEVLMGKSRKEIIGMRQDELHPPEESERYRQISFERLRKGEAIWHDLCIVRDDGTRVPVEISAVAVEIGGQKLLQSFFRDITKRKEAETALFESEQRLKDAQSVAHIGSWHLDIVAGTLTWSDEVYRIFELPYGKPLSYKLFLDCIHPDDRKTVDEAWNEAMAGKPYSIVHRIVSGETLKWVHERAEVTFDREGRAVEGIGTVQDVTKLTEMERLLKHSKEQLETIVSEIAEGILVLDEESVIRFVNPSAASLFGRRSEAIVGIPFGLPDRMDGAVEFEVPRADGSFVHTEMRLVGTEWSGEPAYVVSLHDITERRKLEEERITSAEQLRTAMMAAVNAVAATIEKRDPYTAGHQQRVAHLAEAIAERMGLGHDQIEAIYLCGVIHDIGKVGIPSEILTRPTALTEVEFSMIKTHPEAGFEILKDVPFEYPIAEIIRQHHERMDGSGYPQGLRGEGILLEAKILCVADVVEAMASHRPYRPGLGIDAALKEIETERGRLYDQDVVDACLSLFAEGYTLEGTPRENI